MACWGSNGGNRSSPTSSADINANTKFLAVGAGEEHTCGIKADGSGGLLGVSMKRAKPAPHPTASPRPPISSG